MKKIVLVALVAATSAFGMTNGKSMVELNDCFDGNRCSNLDLNWATDDVEDSELEQLDFALNYNYLFTNHFGAGLTFAKKSQTRDGDIEGVVSTDVSEIVDNGLNNSQTIGVNLFWNFDGGWESSYVAFRYNMTTTEESDDVEGDDLGINAWTLEYGKRMQMGKVFGLALHYAPSVSYTSSTVEPDSGDDVVSNNLRLNVANFAVTF